MQGEVLLDRDKWDVDPKTKLDREYKIFRARQRSGCTEKAHTAHTIIAFVACEWRVCFEWERFMLCLRNN